MSPSFRQTLVVGTFATLCALTVSLAIGMAGRTPVVLSIPASTIATDPASDNGIVTSGDGTVSLRPDIAFLNVGVQSESSTASGAQTDLASRAGKLINEAKKLGIPDKDINTANYSIGPYYTPDGKSLAGYRASEVLELKWHNVDSVGKALDGLVQQGAAGMVNVSFGVNDPKAAMAQARALAIADARSRAAAMAKAAGVNLGQVLKVVDYSSSVRTPSYGYAAADAPAPTQVPVGTLDVNITVTMLFAIA